MIDWVKLALKNTLDFSGRASRSEFWWFSLFNFIVSILASLIDVVTGLYSENLQIGVFGTLVGLGLFITGLSLLFRRLHDIDRSAWWLLISFIPFLGAIVILVFCVMPSSPGSNSYGDGPAQPDDNKQSGTFYG